MKERADLFLDPIPLKVYKPSHRSSTKEERTLPPNPIHQLDTQTIARLGRNTQLEIEEQKNQEDQQQLLTLDRGYLSTKKKVRERVTCLLPPLISLFQAQQSIIVILT